MIRIPSKHHGILTFILVAYCFLAVYYIGLITPTTQTVSSSVTEKDIQKGEEDKPPKTYEAVYTSAKLTNLPNDNLQTFEHPMFPKFALDGDLRSPSPGFRRGSIESDRSQVVIGIPTVKREGKNYLLGTIRSLMQGLIPGRDDVRIVVFIGEIDTGFVREQADIITKEFPTQIESGNLEVISPPIDYYPDWAKVLPLTFGDSFDRVKWRSKQNLDQIFLMMYIYNLAPKYYLMMEDDVIATDGYMEKIMNHITKLKEDDWFYVSFCSLGAIGKLFQKRSLPAYSTFIHMFWNRKPLDWLQLDFVRSKVCSFDENEEQCQIRTQGQTPKYSPSLFQHIGKVSSLKGKTQLLKDNSFKIVS